MDALNILKDVLLNKTDRTVDELKNINENDMTIDEKIKLVTHDNMTHNEVRKIINILLSNDNNGKLLSRYFSISLFVSKIIASTRLFLSISR